MSKKEITTTPNAIACYVSRMVTAIMYHSGVRAIVDEMELIRTLVITDIEEKGALESSEEDYKESLYVVELATELEKKK